MSVSVCIPVSLSLFLHVCVRVCVCVWGVYLYESVSMCVLDVAGEHQDRKGKLWAQDWRLVKARLLKRFWQEPRCPLLASERLADFLWLPVFSSFRGGAGAWYGTPYQVRAVPQGPQQTELGPMVEDLQKPMRLHLKEASDPRS